MPPIPPATRAEIDAQHFLRYVFGSKPVGSAENEAVERDYSPELLAYFQGRIGTVPVRYYWSNQQAASYPQEIAARRNVGELLREIADVLDPRTENEVPSDA